MRRYLVARLASALLVLAGLSLISFGLLALVPGDPAEILAKRGRDVEPSPEQIEAVRHELELDLPVPERYARWLMRVLQGDLGRSLRTGEPVLAEIMVRLPATLELAGVGLAIGLLIALPVGILAAVSAGSWLDQLSRGLALLGAAVPSFWLGAMLIMLFAVRWRWLPAMGRGELSQLVLPGLALGVGTSAALMRLTRASLLEVLGQDHVRTARAKGLRERHVVLRHALRPALLPVVTMLGLQLGNLVGGALVVETIFACQAWASISSRPSWLAISP
jgi:peptide/nickel transport system permease protein